MRIVVPKVWLTSVNAVNSSVAELESSAPVGCVKLVQNKEPQQICGLLGFFFFNYFQLSLRLLPVLLF